MIGNYALCTMGQSLFPQRLLGIRKYYVIEYYICARSVIALAYRILLNRIWKCLKLLIFSWWDDWQIKYTLQCRALMSNHACQHFPDFVNWKEKWYTIVIQQPWHDLKPCSSDPTYFYNLQIFKISKFLRAKMVLTKVWQEIKLLTWFYILTRSKKERRSRKAKKKKEKRGQPSSINKTRYV